MFARSSLSYRSGQNQISFCCLVDIKTPLANENATSMDATLLPYYDILYHIRKSKDYVYGIWVYKALGIWKGYYRVKKSLVSYMKRWTEARNNKYMKYHSKLTYQLSFWNVCRKVDYRTAVSRPFRVFHVYCLFLFFESVFAFALDNRL